MPASEQQMADANKQDNDKPIAPRPAQHQSKDALVAQAKVIEKRKEDAANPTHDPEPNDGWKKQFATWANANEEERFNLVFGMVLTDGASVKDIARFFNVKPDELKPYRHIIDAGKVALKLKVQRNQISLGLQREDQPMFKFFLGKQFAEQVSEPQHEGVESVDNAEVRVQINVLKPEDAVTVGEQVGAALNKTLQ
jgi:hypothetical protein